MLDEVLTVIDPNNIKTFNYDNNFDKKPVYRRNKMRMFKWLLYTYNLN